jgi:hypothetical protein
MKVKTYKDVEFDLSAKALIYNALRVITLGVFGKCRCRACGRKTGFSNPEFIICDSCGVKKWNEKRDV